MNDMITCRAKVFTTPYPAWEWVEKCWKTLHCTARSDLYTWLPYMGILKTLFSQPLEGFLIWFLLYPHYFGRGTQLKGLYQRIIYRFGCEWKCHLILSRSQILKYPGISIRATFLILFFCAPELVVLTWGLEDLRPHCMHNNQ